MTQVHVITKYNRSSHENHLEQYYRLRHDVFVGERGWRDLHRKTASKEMPMTKIPTPFIFSQSTMDASSAGRGSIPRCFHT